MKTFKAALTKIDKKDTAIVWLDTIYKTNPEELKKKIQFYKDLMKMENVVIMFQEGHEEPVYFGPKETVDALKKLFWKQLPWQEFQIS